jgi:hypothetical protein
VQYLSNLRGIVSAAIIGAAMIIISSMPRPLPMPQLMRVITETQKCFELREMVESEKGRIRMNVDRDAYQQMTAEK